MIFPSGTEFIIDYVIPNYEIEIENGKKKKLTKIHIKIPMKLGF